MLNLEIQLFFFFLEKLGRYSYFIVSIPIASLLNSKVSRTFSLLRD